MKLNRIINKNKFIIGIVIIASLLIFIRLGRADMINDDAIYSYRSIGYVDYVSSAVQTTPVQWFKDLPGWSRLSFHDGPPLVAIIQHFFFSIFGSNVIAARLPFAFSGLGAVWFLYLFIKELKGKKNALLAAGILAISNYHIWISRVGYLEGVAVFFIILNLYLFTKAQTNKKYYWWWAVTLGLTLLTKYTTIFLLPVYGVYFLIQNRNIFKDYRLYLYVLIILVIISPVIIYNYQMFVTRGHFDVQLSAIFNQGNKDWPIIGTTLSHDYLASLVGMHTTLVNAVSWPIIIFFYLSILYFLIDLLLKRKKSSFILFLGLGFLTIQFLFIGGGDRFLALYNIFIASFLALFIVKIWYFIPKNFRIIYQIVLAVFVGYSIFFAINTNLLFKPIGQTGLAYSNIRIDNTGYNELDDYLAKLINDRLPGVIIDLWGYQQFDGKAFPQWSKLYLDNFYSGNIGQDSYFPALFIYDDNIVWFAQLWYFERRQLYDNYPFIRLSSFLGIENENPGVFDKQGFETIYFIHPTDKPTLEVQKYRTDNGNRFAESLKERGVSSTPIKNKRGDIAFEVYEMKKN